MPGRNGTGPMGGGPGQGQGFGAQGDCLCPNCGHREPHQRAVPCYARKCSNCGAPLTRA